MTNIITPGGGGSLSIPDAGLPIYFADSASNDAFGRQRVSNPVTLFDSKQLHHKGPRFWDEETSGGSETSIHSSGDASVTMTVTASSGEYVVRQTNMRFNYQPGKSQQILCTFVLGAGVENVVKRIGYFNTSTAAPYTADRDGIYLEQDGSSHYICQSKQGTPTRVEQASWNIDPMDGTGPSGKTIDWSKAQIMFMDFEWLGVGRVRVGFVIDGTIYYVHAFNNANSVTSVYMSSPNHSVRYEIRSNGGTASMQHICSSVASDGGSQALGTMHYVSTGGTHLNADTENTLYALIGIRLKNDRFDTVVRLLNVAINMQTASDIVEWVLLFNPTVDGTFTYQDVDDCCGCQYALGATANDITDIGHAIGGGFVDAASIFAGGNGSAQAQIENALRLGAKLDGTPDEIVLAVRPVGGSTSVDVEGAFFWRELV